MRNANKYNLKDTFSIKKKKERKAHKTSQNIFNDIWVETKVMIDLFSLDKEPAAFVLIIKAFIDHRYHELQAIAGVVIMNQLDK